VIPPKSLRTKTKTRAQQKTKVADRLDKLEAMMVDSASRSSLIAGSDTSLSRTSDRSASIPVRTTSSTEQDDAVSLSSFERTLSPQSERRFLLNQPFNEGVRRLTMGDQFSRPVQQSSAIECSTIALSAPLKSDTILASPALNSNQTTTISSVDCSSHYANSNFGVNDGRNEGVTTIPQR
jgi:hypothetical protein